MADIARCARRLVHGGEGGWGKQSFENASGPPWGRRIGVTAQSLTSVRSDLPVVMSPPPNPPTPTGGPPPPDQTVWHHNHATGPTDQPGGGAIAGMHAEGTLHPDDMARSAARGRPG